MYTTIVQNEIDKQEIEMALEWGKLIEKTDSP